MAKNAAIETFRARCRQAFRFLEHEYGVAERRLPTQQGIDRLQVQYVHSVTLVAVEGIHWGSSISVRVGRVEPEAWETWRHDGLEDLLHLRCPELSLVGPDGVHVSRDQSFQLTHDAHALKTCAADVWRGDFSVLPQWHQVIERRATPCLGGTA